MKALRLIAVVMTVVAVSASAQYGIDKKLSLYLAGGYGFGISGVYFGQSYNDGTGEVRDVFNNCGKGLKLDAGVFYRIMEDVDIQCAFIFSGAVPQARTENELTIANLRTTTEYGFSSFSMGGKLLIMPRFSLFDVIDMYCGMGLGLVFTGSSYELDTINNTSGQTTTSRETGEYKNLPSVPFYGALGAEYPVADFMVIFGEFSLEVMNVTQKELRVVEADGDIRTEIYENNVDDRTPRPKIPASNVGLRLGVRFPIL